MAEPGFPWHAQSRDPEKEAIVPKENAATSRPDDATQADAPITHKKAGSSSQHCQLRNQNSTHAKHRNGSLKGHPRAKPPALKVPTDATPAKASTPLPVRTIPPWVRDAEADDLEDPPSPDAPNAAFVASHHYNPLTARRPLLPDHGFVASPGGIHAQRPSRWISFGRPSAYPRENFDGEKVDQEWFNQNFTNYSTPWLAGHEDDDDDDASSRYRAFRRKRKVWYKRAQFTILRNPFIPLAFRLTVLAFAIAALILGASIYLETGRIMRCLHEEPGRRSERCVEIVGHSRLDFYRDPSGLMAVIVDAIAIIYTIYITYDEYFSKPLGLRRARSKVRLVLLDLFFVVFQSANLALSFESLAVDEGACQIGETPATSVRFDRVCDRAQALSGVLVVSLTAWLLTFSVSVLRLVERIDTK